MGWRQAIDIQTLTTTLFNVLNAIRQNLYKPLVDQMRVFGIKLLRWLSREHAYRIA